MKKGYLKVVANSDSFSDLQGLIGYIKLNLEVKNVKWGGYWNGLHFSSFSFYCTKETFEIINLFCKKYDFKINFTHKF